MALLVGGDSTEREVSLSTGGSMAKALDPALFEVTAYDITREGKTSAPNLVPLAWSQLVSVLVENKFDVVLPALHGGWGEDGTMQSLLNVAGIPFVGSGAHACAIAIDKPLAKAYARDFGITSPQGLFISSLEELDASQVSLPCVVKPAGGGSSVGVAILQEGESDKLLRAVEKALADGSGVLIEEFIAGVEVTCAVLAGKALPVIEIVPMKGEGFYDYEAKYAAGGSDHLIPPQSLDVETQKRIQEAAERVYQVFGCGGVARADFIVPPSGQPYFLEINLLPGMTSTSLVPDAARAVDMSFPDLLDHLIKDALSR